MKLKKNEEIGLVKKRLAEEQVCPRGKISVVFLTREEHEAQ